MKVTILGCGASAGVPLIGCECAVCCSANPRNQRSRASILIESATTRILVDTSPDLRQQALRAGIKTIDAIIYTHAHADHLHGMDDIRSFNHHGQHAIPAYGDAETMAEIQQRFDYVFQPPIPEYGWFRPCMTAHVVTPGQPLQIGDITLHPFHQEHGRVKSLGLRAGDFVYSTDVKAFPPAAAPYLKDIDCWLLDCLTDERPMPTHADLDLALQWVTQYQPKRTILTHLSHALDYDALQTTLPSGVEVAYDGMVL